jgi:hypothetical protein
MTNNSTETWEVRPGSKTTNTPQQATAAPVPRTPVDLTRNKELAMRAKMSVSHERAQRLLHNFLLAPAYGQREADIAVRILEACGELREISVREVGNWDSVGQCMALTLFHDQRPWLVQWSGFIVWGQEDFRAAMELVFGDQFVEEPFIERLDNQGNAMLVTAASF